MTSVRVIASGENSFQLLAQSLRLRLAPGANLDMTVTSTLVRRLAAVLAPCSREDLLTRASTALAGCYADSLREVLQETVDDLIVGGDLTEQPALVEGMDEASILIFCSQPCFHVTGRRIHLLGATPDDAPCLPGSVTKDLLCDAGMRYLEVDDVDSMRDVLLKMGLHEIAVDRWMGVSNTGTPQDLIARHRVILQSLGREEALVDLRWLAPSDNGVPYRQRWRESVNDEGLYIARAPQPYGADAWYVAEYRAGRRRFVQLPIEELLDERACDSAWRLQLAIDAVAGNPARYAITVESDIATIRVDFPMPLRERRKLLHLGGRRNDVDTPFTFLTPRQSLAAVESILHGAGYASFRGPLA